MIFLEKGVVQRTSLLISSTSRSGDNLAILLEGPAEYHDPHIGYHDIPVDLEFKRESCLSRHNEVVLGASART